MLTETGRRASACSSAELLGALAQGFGEALGVVHLRRQEHHEAVAGDARAEAPARQALADELAELSEDRVPDVHAGLLVDGVQLVDVEVERAPALSGLALGEHGAHAPLEGRRGCRARRARRSWTR